MCVVAQEDIWEEGRRGREAGGRGTISTESRQGTRTNASLLQPRTLSPSP